MILQQKKILSLLPLLLQMNEFSFSFRNFVLIKQNVKVWVFNFICLCILFNENTAINTCDSMHTENWIDTSISNLPMLSSWFDNFFLTKNENRTHTHTLQDKMEYKYLSWICVCLCILLNIFGLYWLFVLFISLLCFALG